MPDRLGSVARSTALAIAVLLVAFLVAAAIVRLPPIQRWTAQRVSARLPAGVSIERARLTLVPPGVRLVNVSLAPDGPTLKSLFCRVRVSTLLAGRVEIAALAVDGAAITVERAADGTIQIAGVLAPLLDSLAGTAPAAPELNVAALPALAVGNATVTFVDRTARGGARTLQLTDGQLTLGSATPSGAPFTLAARLDPLGQLSAQGALRAVAAAAAGPADRAIDATVTARRSMLRPCSPISPQSCPAAERPGRRARWTARSPCPAASLRGSRPRVLDPGVRVDGLGSGPPRRAADPRGTRRRVGGGHRDVGWPAHDRQSRRRAHRRQRRNAARSDVARTLTSVRGRHRVRRDMDAERDAGVDRASEFDIACAPTASPVEACSPR